MLKELVGNTPLIQLDSGIYAKLETYNPTGSIKDRVISYIVNLAIENNEITKDTILVEATSGNTGIALAAIGAKLGNKVKIIMPCNMSEERRCMMRLFGAEIIETGPHEFAEAIEFRNALVKDGYWSPMQFENPQNIECHFKTTAREIFDQLDGKKWGGFVSGSGTGGTMMGVQRFLVENKIDAKTALVRPAEEEHGIQGIGDGASYLMEEKVANYIIDIKTEDAEEKMVLLTRELGVPVGISSAANVLAAEELLRLGVGGEIVTVLPDRGERYMSCETILERF